MKIKGVTDIGSVRSSNQDTFRFFDCGNNTGFIIVCDGMGGPGGGEVASRYVADKLYTELSHKFQLTKLDKLPDLLDILLSQANAELIELSHNEGQYEGMGTTTVMAFIKEGKCLVANIGDSRAYHIFDDHIVQISKDHSMVQQLVDDGKISESEARHHPQKNIITRAVGAYATAQADYFVFDLLTDSQLLLCTDGLSNNIDENEMLFEVTTSENLDVACDSMVKLANERGGNDNITVVLLSMAE